MKVRIAVAVNSVGGWAAIGAFGMADDIAQEATQKAVTDEGTGSSLVSFIEADVPEPAQQETIVGTVTLAEPKTEAAQKCGKVVP